MAAHPNLRRFTPEEYLLLERGAGTRNEYVDGLIFAMAGGTYNHDTVIMNLTYLLQNQLKGGKCSVRSADFRIAASKRGPFFYPDLSVFCGKPQFLDETQDCGLNPTVVFEVLSKSTRKYDRETKVVSYADIPSLRHIVLVSQFSVSVEHRFRAGENGKWKAEKFDVRGATVELAAAGARLALAGIYEGMFSPALSKRPSV